MKPIFKATDGSEHKTAEAAERRETLLKRASQLEEVARAVEVLLGESALTADGQHFQWYGRRDYWIIRPCYGYVARLEEVSLWPHTMRVNYNYQHLEPHLEVMDFKGDKWVSYKVGELYADKKKANTALLAEVERRLAEMEADVQKLRVSLESGSQ